MHMARAARCVTQGQVLEIGHMHFFGPLAPPVSTDLWFQKNGTNTQKSNKVSNVTKLLFKLTAF
jgi:hypothetical protein